MRLLKKNEIPYEEAKIYPEFESKEAFIVNSDTGMYRYIYRITTFVKINRDNVDYLIFATRQHEEMVNHTDKSKIDLSKFMKYFKDECERIIKYYKIDKNTELADGNEIVIYKYID